MAPVEQRIADRFSETFGPLKELLFSRGISCDIAFFYAAGTHEAPFIMIASEPYLRDVFKLSVFCDLFRINMAMIIKDRSFFGIIMKKSSGSIR